GQVPGGDGRGHFGNVAYLSGQVASHRVDAVRQVLPNAGHALHVRLATQLALGADFEGDTSHFGGKGIELVHHGIDGVLQLQDFAADFAGLLFAQVPVGDGRGHFGDVAHLGREVAGHEIDAVGQVFPGAGHASDIRLAAQPSLRTDFTGDAG